MHTIISHQGDTNRNHSQNQRWTSPRMWGERHSQAALVDVECNHLGEQGGKIYGSKIRTLFTRRFHSRVFTQKERVSISIWRHVQGHLWVMRPKTPETTQINSRVEKEVALFSLRGILSNDREGAADTRQPGWISQTYYAEPKKQPLKVTS